MNHNSLLLSDKLKEFANPEFVDILADYKQIRDCFDGSRAIKEATQMYLPSLTGQSQDDYANYLRRALFFPITGKTCSTLVGLATATKPKVEAPDLMADYFTDTNPGFQFSEMVQAIFTEVLLMGRYGVLIDASSDGRPKPVPYIAENIVRWKTDDLDRPIEIGFREHAYEPVPNSSWASKMVCRYRVCSIVAGVYTVQVYDDALTPVGAPIVPLFSGEPIDYIPFVPFGSSGIHMWLDKPPMLDISTINLSHYLSSADLEWGRHLTGLPTPVVSGVDASTKLHIGGTAAWILPDVSAKAFYLEFQGQGLQSLEKAMSEKVGLMATMSARLVDTASKGSEAAETVRLRYASDSASLIHVVGSVEAGLTLMYTTISALMKGGPVKVSLSKDVLGTAITFGDLKVLFEGYLQGALSKESLLYNLRRLGASDPTRSDADELAAIREPKPQPTPPKQTN